MVKRPLFLLSAVVALLLLVVPADAGYSRIAPSVQPLKAVLENSLQTICTTTSINEAKGYWLTAAHCVGQLKAKNTAFIYDTYIEGELTEIVMVNFETDLAVLKTVNHHSKALHGQSTPPEVGQAIFMVGHPLGLAAQWFQGFISSVDTVVNSQFHFLLFQMTACGGNSGSVVVNGKDEIVSVLQIGLGASPCYSFSGGAPWAEVQSVLQKFGEQ